MTITPNGLQYTIKERGYLAAHVGWVEPALSVIVAISVAESQGFSTAYRPESLNPAGGRDFGIVMINDKYWPVPDPFTRLDAIVCLTEARSIWSRWQFVPWAYPSKRSDATLGVAAIRAEIGANPLDISHSPYWRMRRAGVPTHDLPRPPAGTYVSPLPAAPLKYGDSSAKSKDVGDRVNQLQRALIADRRWSRGTTTDWYYGNTVRDGIAGLQTDLKRLGLWTGATDGREYTPALRDAWDAVLRYQLEGEYR